MDNKQIFEKLKLRAKICDDVADSRTENSGNSVISSDADDISNGSTPARESAAPIANATVSSSDVLRVPNTGFSNNQITGLSLICFSAVVILATIFTKRG